MLVQVLLLVTISHQLLSQKIWAPHLSAMYINLLSIVTVQELIYLPPPSNQLVFIHNARLPYLLVIVHHLFMHNFWITSTHLRLIKEVKELH